MKTTVLITALFVCLPVSLVQAGDTTVNALLESYASQGASSADAERGKQLWQKKFAERSCVDCHTQDLKTAGKHVSTGKLIEPMSASINAERLTDPAKVEKWFLRNCKWTLGRECSAQEKTDFLLYINQ